MTAPVEQLQLVPAPPRLTERQQAILDALTQAGHDGLKPSQVGAHWHALKDHHAPWFECQFCHKTGLEILHALRAKGLARYRAGKLKVWQAVDLPADLADDNRLLSGMSAEIPY